MLLTIVTQGRNTMAALYSVVLVRSLRAHTRPDVIVNLAGSLTCSRIDGKIEVEHFQTQKPDGQNTDKQ